MEDRIGSIEVGKLADLVVIDEALFGMDRHGLRFAKQPGSRLLAGATAAAPRPQELDGDLAIEQRIAGRLEPGRWFPPNGAPGPKSVWTFPAG